MVVILIYNENSNLNVANSLCSNTIIKSGEIRFVDVQDCKFNKHSSNRRRKIHIFFINRRAKNDDYCFLELLNKNVAYYEKSTQMYKICFKVTRSGCVPLGNLQIYVGPLLFCYGFFRS